MIHSSTGTCVHIRLSRRASRSKACCWSVSGCRVWVSAASHPLTPRLCFSFLHFSVIPTHSGSGSFVQVLKVPMPANSSRRQPTFVNCAVLQSVIDDLHHDLDYIPVSSKPLRQALAAIDITDRRFALNTKADVDEALYAMLAQIHREHVKFSPFSTLLG
jgi:hypothetical protein